MWQSSFEFRHSYATRERGHFVHTGNYIVDIEMTVHGVHSMPLYSALGPAGVALSKPHAWGKSIKKLAHCALQMHNAQPITCLLRLAVFADPPTAAAVEGAASACEDRRLSQLLLWQHKLEGEAGSCSPFACWTYSLASRCLCDPVVSMLILLLLQRYVGHHTAHVASLLMMQGQVLGR